MEMTLKPYAHYRQSRHPWLSSIPTHWEERRAKFYFREIDERSVTGREELLSVSHLTGVTPRSEKNVTMFKAESYVGHKLCGEGDLVINTMWAWMGALGIAPRRGIISSSYGVYRPMKNAFVPDYLNNLLRTRFYVSEYICRSTGIRSSRLRLYPDQFLDIPVLRPPLDEQVQMGRYLRAKNAQFLRLIRAKQRLIALLNEQKQAIIQRAVTRGFNPDVPLKPSGVDWLGDVPEHWDVVPFKLNIGFQEGPGIMAADFRESGTPLIRIAGLRAAKANLAGCNYLDPPKVEAKWSHFKIQRGDYLLSASASTGDVLEASHEVVGAIPYTGIIRLWPRTERVNMEYVRYFAASRLFQDQVDMMKSGVGIEHFGPTHLRRMLVVLPPKAEQDRLVKHLRSEVASLDGLADKAQSEITLIREYRQRLVADVVTGKLDVRGVAVPEGEGDGADAELDVAEDDGSILNEEELAMEDET